MPRFGATSLKNREELHDDLKRIVDIAIKRWDCSIIDGGRTLEEQRKNVAKGVSQTMASKHLFQADGKAHAMDIIPYPYNWNAIEKGLNAIKRADGGMEIAEVYAFFGYIQGIADTLGIPIRSGADWNSNRQFEDQSFHDLPHHERIG